MKLREKLRNIKMQIVIYIIILLALLYTLNPRSKMHMV